MSSFLKKERYVEQSGALKDLVGKLNQVVPLELKYFDYNRSTIFDVLYEIAQNTPLRELALGLFREETSHYTSVYGVRIDARLVRFINTLPNLRTLPSLNVESQPVSEYALFQLLHDTAGNALEQYRTKAPKGIHSHAIYFGPSLFGKIRYFRSYHIELLNETADAGQRERSQMLIKGYWLLLQKIAAEIIIPNATLGIQEPIPLGNFELYELRSAYRELLGWSPLQFAEAFLLRTAIEEFITKRKFHDKNLHVPVVIQMDKRSNDPQVFMDKGDLYRMLRNLLRDAVVHTQASEIRPVIQVSGEGSYAQLRIFSQGHLDSGVLTIIGRQAYTTQDRQEKVHGYGKVGARKLIQELWSANGLSSAQIETFLHDHWTNGMYNRVPHVVWTAPLPYAR